MNKDDFMCPFICIVITFIQSTLDHLNLKIKQ